jgi:teichuronic acid biosynthesis glycosyltransferase TuaC
MKIAVVTQTFPVREQPYRGHSVYQTLLRLRKLATVNVYSPQATYPSWLHATSRTWAKTDLSYSPELLNAQYFSYPAVPVLSRPVNGLLCARKLEPFLKKNPPDVILSYWVYPDGFSAVHVGRKLGVPVVVKAIGSDVNHASDAVSATLVQYVLNRANRVLTVSEHLRGKVIGNGVAPAKVITVVNGCDTSIFCNADREKARRELGILPDTNLVLYVGRFDLAKGLRELLRATSNLVQNFPSLQLAMVGDGPAAAELARLARTLGLTGRVIFVPACSSRDVARWMAAATLCTLPSYREGCPSVVLEALSSGRAIVATAVGGIPELVTDDSAILVPSRDAVALTEGIRSALERSWDSVEISRRMGRGWDDVARETFDVCQNVLHEHRSRGSQTLAQLHTGTHA